MRTVADTVYGPEWQAQRRRALRASGGRCARCWRTRSNLVRLHVHHVVPWWVTHDSDQPNLAVVCLTCHYTIHARYRRAGCRTPDEFITTFQADIGQAGRVLWR